LTTTFDELPMLPFTKFTLKLRGGDRAVLVTPASCGQHAIESSLTPWKTAPNFAPSGDAHPQGSFSTSYDGQGADCPGARPFDPPGAASTTPAQAGAATSLAMSLAVPDRHQLLKTMRLSLPPGLVG